MPKPPAPRPAASLLLPAGLWLIAAAVPLVWNTGVHAALTLPKLALVAAGLLVSCAGAVWSWKRGAFQPEATPLDAPLLVGVAVLAVCALASQDPWLSWLGNYNYYAYGVWPATMFAALCLLSSWGLAQGRRREAVLQACLASTALAGLYAVGEVSGFEPFPEIGILLNGRAVSTMGSPVSLGVCMALAAPLGLHWALERRGQRAFGWPCFILILGGLYASISRAAWIAAALACFSYLALTGRLSGLWRTRARAAAAGLLCLALGAGIYHRLSSRAATTVQESARVDVWRAAWTSWRAHPWLGSGPDTFELGFRRYKTVDYVRGSAATAEYQAHAHNDFLQALATTGLAGLAVYLWFLAALAVAAWKCLAGESRAEAAALSCGLLALFINMKFNPVPVEALALGALMAGLLRPTGEPIRPRGAWVLVALAAFALAGAAAAAHLWAANRDFKAAILLARAGRPEVATQRFESALRRQPCELTFAIEYINFLNGRADRVPAGPLRSGLHDRGAEAALGAVRCHPNVGNAHYCLGVARTVQSLDGRPELLREGEAQLDMAMGLDPLFVPILGARMWAARLRGDKVLAQELAARIQRLDDTARK